MPDSRFVARLVYTTTLPSALIAGSNELLFPPVAGAPLAWLTSVSVSLVTSYR